MFVIISNNQIIGNYNNLESALLCLLDNCIKNNTNCLVYELMLNSNITLNKYFVNDDNLLIDNSDKPIDLKSFKYHKYILNKLKDLRDNQNLDIFIPIQEQNYAARIKDTSQKIEESHTQILQRKLQELQMKKDLINNKINEKKQFIETNEKSVINKKLELTDIKKKMKIYKDNLEEFNSIYVSDKKNYFRFKNEIASGDLGEHEIPVIFKNKWNLFQKMDDLTYLTDNLDFHIINYDELKHYKELLKDYKEVIIPTSYDNMFYCENLGVETTEDESENNETESITTEEVPDLI